MGWVALKLVWTYGYVKDYKEWNGLPKNDCVHFWVSPIYFSEVCSQYFLWFSDFVAWKGRIPTFNTRVPGKLMATVTNRPYATLPRSSEQSTPITMLCDVNMKVPPQDLQTETKMSCNYCGKCFVSRTGLRNHLNSHEGKFRYNCVVCKKGFQVKMNYIQHMHSHLNYKPYCCDICNKEFTFKYSAKRHKIDCHPVSSNLSWPDSPQ